MLIDRDVSHYNLFNLFLSLNFLMFLLNDNVTVFDHCVGKKLYNYDQDLEAALSCTESLLKFSLGIYLFLELLVALTKIGSCLVLESVKLVVDAGLDALALLVLEVLVLAVYVLDGSDQGFENSLVVENWHEVADALFLVLLDHESHAVDGKNTILSVSVVI